MTSQVTWQEVVIRLAWTVVAGAIIGFNREERSRPAGLRTTLLVCLAASVSMIQANLLMNTVGKRPDSFVVLDLMRLPLGILTGVGFIGGGAILRKDNMVVGVTTAATLWFVTVMGLCFGGGQIALGVAALVLGWLALTALKKVEKMSKQVQRGTLFVALTADEPGEKELSKMLTNAGYKVATTNVNYSKGLADRDYSYEFRWHSSHASPPRDLLRAIEALPGIKTFSWKPAPSH